MSIPYIIASDVALSWPDIVAALLAGHKGVRPQISDQLLHRGEDVLLSRAAWIDGLGVAVKSVTVFPSQEPSVQGAMLLFNDASGAVEAVIDSALVTRWKTVADSVLGARLLARRDVKRLLIIGAGAVAEGLAVAYPVLFPGMDVEIWNRSAGKAVALADKVGAKAVGNLRAAVMRADIISTATMAKTPVLKGEWLQAGQHLDLIGAFTAEMREADDACLQRSRIFVDSVATTIDHIGELMIPLASGAIARKDVRGDLYDLAQGAAGRVAADDITLFKNGGGAHLDLMVGRVILAAYRAQSA
ncbi:MAG TPA: ornithine cyclodeaminase [Rhodobacteraceae bacterium]|nr:ornithine cyclodeaminase [Paracoccaceae bacterium]